MKFENNKYITSKVKNILKEHNFIIMTEIQQKVLDYNNKNLIVQAPTGSGKTLCYLIPLANILNNLTVRHNNVKKIYGIILVPTRELCLQIHELANMFQIDNKIFVGGDNELDDSSINSHLIIGTPGRMLFLIKKNPNRFHKLKYLILDEADKLLFQGFDNYARIILDQIAKKTEIVQFYSATINEEVQLEAQKIGNYNEIIMNNIKPVTLNIFYMILHADKKIDTCLELFKNHSKVIVFFGTCAEVDYFYNLLVIYFTNNKDIHPNYDTNNLMLLHGKIKQYNRNIIFEQIKQSTKYLLLTTDLSARGFDFQNINLVIHFDIPKDPSNILHRSGRTGRNGKTGESIIFLLNNELHYLKYITLKYKTLSIQEYRNYTIDNIIFENNDKLIKLGTKAFVSYIRFYKEHILNYILDYKQLNLDDIKTMFQLKRIPKLKELNKFGKY